MNKEVFSFRNLIIASLSIITFSILFILISQYKAINSQGEAIVTDIKSVASVTVLHEQLKRSKGIEEWKKYLRAFEATGNKKNSATIEKVKSIFSPLMEHYSQRPREIEDKSLMQQKREYLELLQAKLRRDKADISSSTLLVSMIQDAQRGLWQDGIDSDMLLIKKAKEKSTALRTISRNRTDLPTLFGVIEKLEMNIAAAKNWQIRKDELFQIADKQILAITDDSKKSSEENLSNAQNYFFKSIIVSFFALALAVLIFYFGYKRELINKQKEIAALHLLAKGVSSDAENVNLTQQMKAVAEKIVHLQSQHYEVSTKLDAWQGLPIWTLIADASGKILFNTDLVKEDFGELDSIHDFFTSHNFLHPEKIINEIKNKPNGNNLSEINFDGKRITLEIIWNSIGAKGRYSNATILVLQKRLEEESALQAVVAEILRPLYESGYRGKVHPLVQPALDKFHEFNRRESEQQLYFKAEVESLKDQLERSLEFREKESSIASSFISSANDLHRRMEQLSNEETNHLGDLQKLNSDLVSAATIVDDLEDFLNEYRSNKESYNRFLKRLRAEHSAIQESFVIAQADLDKIKFTMEEAKLQGLNFSLQTADNNQAFRSYRQIIQLTSHSIEKFESVMHTLRNFITKSVVSSESMHIAGDDELPSIANAHHALRQIDQYLQKWHSLGLKKQTSSMAAKESANTLLVNSRELQDWSKRSEELNNKIVDRLSNWN